MGYDQLHETGELIVNFRKSMQPTIDVINKINKNIQPTFEAINNITKNMQPVIKTMSELSLKMKPIIKYIYENRDNIENFYESFNELIIYYKKHYRISEDEAIELIDQNESEGKVFIDENWEFQIVDNQVAATTSKPKPKITIQDIINLASIASNIFLTSSIEFDFDNSTNIENHYHIEQHVHTENTMVLDRDNVNLYGEPNDNAGIVGTLDSGIELIKTTNENGYTLVIILDNDKQIEMNGWIKDKYNID